MSCTIEDFRTRFPEFSDETEFPDLRIQMFLDDAVLHIGTSENYWKGKYDIAHCYLTAHLLTVGTGTEAGNVSATAGPISSKKAGGLSITRAVAAKDRSDANSFYTTTSYGQYFITIRSTVFAGIQVAV